MSPYALTLIPAVPVIEVVLMLQYCFAQEAPGPWARRHFGDARLGDRRRTRRVIQLAQTWATDAGASIPAMLDEPYAIKAAYQLFARPEATPDRLQAGHRELLARQLRTASQSFLLIEDSSELSWAGNAPVRGLGPIGLGAEGLQGFKLHSVLAARWPTLAWEQTEAQRPPVEVLGLADQQFHVRRPRPAHERRNCGARGRKGRARESRLWPQATERLGAAPPDARWVRVCDREADIYDFLLGLKQAGHGFVVRAAQDRVLVRVAGQHDATKLFGYTRGLKPFQPTLQLELRARGAQPARSARLALSAGPALIQAPHNLACRGGEYEPIACWVVRAFEPDPPAGVSGLEWILLTERPVADFAAARETVLQYSARWLIEEFHKALKSALGAERLQLETAQRLFAALAIMSVVALRLIDLRERVRIDPQAPAEASGLTPLELEVLRLRLKRKIITRGEVALAVGRLGGHMNRRRDRMPGWKTLWVGMRKLQCIVQGYLLSQDGDRFG
jgi:hypothetical protein